MKNKTAVKLTINEAKLLEKFIDKKGGQVPACLLFNVAPSTLSRNVNRHTAPSPMLRDKLVECGIVKA